MGFPDTTLGEAGIGWAVSLQGNTTAPTEAFAGSHHRYAFPRITTLAVPANMGLLGIQAVAPESMVSIQPRNFPAEYVPTISSPAVEDPTAPIWRLLLRNAGTAAGFRLTGVDLQDEMEVQRKLFLASAAAGIAGGGLIWLVGAMGPALNDYSQKRRNRRETPEEEAGALTPPLTNRTEIPDSLAYSRVIAASTLLAFAGSTLVWIIKKCRRKL